MIQTQKIRELHLTHGTSESRTPFISAASGLVKVNNLLYVVADDEHHLGVFSAGLALPGELVRLFDGTLPDRSQKRKAQKPDLETLLLLPVFAGHPHGALLAMGSGSTPNRDTGVLLGLDASGNVNAAPRLIDLRLLYDAIRANFNELNIEGAVIAGGQLMLLQRGNKGAVNALVACELESFIDDLAANNVPRLRASPVVRTVALGDIDGVPLCFTDATALPDGNVLFTAVAENTDNSFDDGSCGGSAIGLLDANGNVKLIERLNHPYKIEGVAATMHADGIHLLLVTDADDASQAAWLLSAVLTETGPA
ncbi:MAG: hypothetical protein LH481_02940 [Burkholderiales bacterium]|nr:hypothetical protein [Burkholderiales bacterium]